jgi:hypothetical protein
MTRDRFLAIILSTFTFGSVGAGATYFVVARDPPVPVDANGCPPAPVATWLVAIDQTDPAPQRERHRFAQIVARIGATMPVHSRLVLHRITANVEDAAAPAPLSDRPLGFARCKPIDPNLVNRHVDNPRMAQVRLDREFLTPLARAATELAPSTGNPRSPILESIDAMLWSPLFRPPQPRTLVIVSDLLVNTRKFSQLRTSLDACRVLSSTIGRRLAAHDWSNIRVQLEYVRNARDALHQGHAHLRFWGDLFHRLGAAEVREGARALPAPHPCPSPIAGPRKKRRR